MSKKREILYRSILLATSLLFVIGACELFLRLALFSDSFKIPQLRHAWRYADASLDDDYWKLSYMFKDKRGATAAGYRDPRLGWGRKSSADNPLGIIYNKPYRIEDFNQPILFYGDSFVAGVTSDSDRIPQLLDQLMPDRSVLNFGVSGYGVGQIYLRYSDTIEKFNQPLALVGILMDDLNRSILSFRSGPKPYFDHDENGLILRNSPNNLGVDEYLEKNPPEISSYFLRFVSFQLQCCIPESTFKWLLGYDIKHDKKIAINRLILESIKSKAKTSASAMYTVLFYSGEEIIEAESWNERYIKDTLVNLGIQYFDTKAYLNNYMKKTGKTIGDLYYDDNGHPNAAGNRIIAEGLLDWLQSR